MTMRILALVAVTWSFVGVPTLCRAGILVECCDSGIPGHDTSNDAPGKCPSNDPRDKCSDGTESSRPRDCDSCAESCHVVSPHTKQTDRDHFAVMFVPLIAVTQPLCDAFVLDQHRPRRLNSVQFGENVPVAPSDRPLLI